MFREGERWEKSEMAVSAAGGKNGCLYCSVLASSGSINLANLLSDFERSSYDGEEMMIPSSQSPNQS